MRTTVTFADDVAAAVDRLRRQRGVGVSEVVNDLIRAGLADDVPRGEFRQRSHDMGAKMDFDNIAEVIETLEGPTAR